MKNKNSKLPLFLIAAAWSIFIIIVSVNMLTKPADKKEGSSMPSGTAQTAAGAEVKDLNTSGPKPVVYVWFPARFGTWETSGVKWNLIDFICFRSVEILADGKIRRPAGDPPSSFVKEAHRNGVKVTVLAWVTSKETSNSYLAKHPKETAESLLEYVKKNNLDGVNIDDERMQEFNDELGGAENKFYATNFFSILYKTFKDQNQNYHVSYAAPAVISKKDKWAVTWVDMKSISGTVDAIMPMAYCQNPPTIGWSTNAEPLGGGGKTKDSTTRDIKTVTDDYLAAMGGKKEKLFMGVTVGFGGMEFSCRTDTRLSPTVGKGTVRTLEECEAKAAKYGKKWDDEQKSEWYVYKDKENYVQGWYSDLKSWNEKLDWIKKQNLGGIGVWVMDGVNDPPEFWEALKEFKK